MSDNLATNFYVEFQTVVQHIGDDTLAEDVATWARKAVLDDMREWADTLDPPPRSYEGANFFALLDAYAKENGVE